MNRCLLQGAGSGSTTLEKRHCPLIPNLRIGIVAPDLNLNNLALTYYDRYTDGEVEREPRLHRWCMLLRLNAVENILVQLSGKVPSESMQLSLRLLYGETQTAVFAK